MSNRPQKTELAFEESLSDDWSKDFEVVEVPLDNRSIFLTGLIIFIIGLIAVGRIVFLGVVKADYYSSRAEDNLEQVQITPAPRGLIFDRYGKILANNRQTFSALLEIDKFLGQPALQQETLKAIKDILGLSIEEIFGLIESRDLEQAKGPLVLNADLEPEQVIKLKSLNLPTIVVSSSFGRDYPDGQIFSSIIGYTGLTNSDDLKNNSELSSQDYIGRAGIESFYDRKLRGRPGILIERRDAAGRVLGEQEKSQPAIGDSIHLTIDAEFQNYFYERMKQGLESLGRNRGVGLALNPQNGEILALLNFPTYDNNLFAEPGSNQEIKNLLNSFEHPLFNRAVSGFYNPGSTIKPLVGTAALKEGVIDTKRTIFSPGYLDVPNPYNPDQPSRFLDWRYQGDVNLAAAIAQSSNVYFYEVGGGAPDGSLKGLGISRLRDWWQKFNLGNLTGIDLPGEAKGFLPSPDWKENKTERPWLLGDTYNVSIGQGDLLLTPIQLLSYISAFAAGGKIYQPVINKDAEHPKILTDLSELEPQINEVRKGMRQAVTNNLGTAHLLADLGFAVEAKTGSAQVHNNAQENAFFVGYTPSENPQVAVLVLIENSREGSLNAVPIAKDVLNWYYWNRVKK